LYGDRGRDTIAGAAGDDLLDGQVGNDSLDGGDGTDTCQNGETVVNCEALRKPAPADLDLGIAHRSIARAVRARWSVYARR
jgi:hypothetical protein